MDILIKEAFKTRREAQKFLDEKIEELRKHKAFVSCSGIGVNGIRGYWEAMKEYHYIAFIRGFSWMPSKIMKKLRMKDKRYKDNKESNDLIINSKKLAGINCMECGNPLNSKELKKEQNICDKCLIPAKVNTFHPNEDLFNKLEKEVG